MTTSTRQNGLPIIVIGAGPAGLMTAIAAARADARVVVLEALARPGLKLLATGGGRCNVTNTLGSEEFCQRLGKDGRFAMPALEHLSAEKLQTFFASLGVPTFSPDGFHIFPKSERAVDVLNALLAEASRLGVTVSCGKRVAGLVIEEGAVHGVTTSSATELRGRHVVIACGGMSYASLGGSGDAFSLARQAGHSVVPPVPALASLHVNEKWPGRCAGISFENVKLWLPDSGRRKVESAGALLFTHSGISGPAALDISGKVARLLLSKRPVALMMNLLPERQAESLAALFEEWRTRSGAKKIKNLVDELLPRSLAGELLVLSGCDGDIPVARLRTTERDAVIRQLTSAELSVVGTDGFEKAMATSGGVSLREIDPRSMRSRIVQGLSFAGEAVDLDGPCGGFNLQWAFASGWLAGEGAAKDFT